MTAPNPAEHVDHYSEAARLLGPSTVRSAATGEPREAPPTTDAILRGIGHALLALHQQSAAAAADAQAVVARMEAFQRETADLMGPDPSHY